MVIPLGFLLRSSQATQSWGPRGGALGGYLYRFDDQSPVSTNYTISSESWFTDKILDSLGLTGFDSNAIGLVAQFDDRDNQNSPTSGQFFNVNNLAYREGLGGDESFDVFNMDYRRYIEHGDGHVFAWRTRARVTDDAPIGGYSSVQLRGYVPGNYLAPHGFTIEGEERYRLNDRWGLAGFGGLACLLEDISDCGDRENWYPAIGAGLIFALKPKEKIVVRLDYAAGEADNSGIYLSFGHPF